MSCRSGASSFHWVHPAAFQNRWRMTFEKSARKDAGSTAIFWLFLAPGKATTTEAQFGPGAHEAPHQDRSLRSPAWVNR
jgi:hypothetical protein